MQPTAAASSPPKASSASAEDLDALKTLARALGRQAARQTWAEAAQPSIAAPSPEVTLLTQPSKRSGRDHAAG